MKIREELKDLIPPLTKEEYSMLEQSILKEGVRDPITIWNGIIVDGHNRYAICQKHGLEFSTVGKDFANINEVKIWIIENQLGRRNLSKFTRTELALLSKTILAEKAKERQGTRTDIVLNSGQCSVEEKYKKEIDNIRSDKTLSYDDKVWKIDTIKLQQGKELQKLNKSATQQVYVAKSGDTIKIGVSINPEDRVESLKIGSPDIELIMTFDGDRKLEKKLHKLFLNDLLGHEWFKYSDGMFDKIKDCVDKYIVKENKTDTIVAKKAGVSHDTINRVEKIKEIADEETIQKLREGKVSINEVYTKIKKDERKEYLKDRPSMVEKYVVPPFSVLDTKQGYWKNRKEEWLNIGIKSELGRDAECLPRGFDESRYGKKQAQGTSIFDPVLCEIMYRWFCPAGGSVIDCFAGGSVRGIVATELGFNYTGIDLNDKQINENIKQADIICKNNKPKWYIGDSLDIKNIANGEYDFIFSCPPYHDLEVYTDDSKDISNMDYDEFIETYNNIIKETVSMLNENSFACFVVSEVRGKNGMYKNFVSDTVAAFLNTGMSYYNELILVNSAGTLPLRAGRYLESSRKIGRMHQNVLVFLKGDIKETARKFSDE